MSVHPAGQIFQELTAVERKAIDAEHARLEEFLHDLRETCSEFGNLRECDVCGTEKSATCKGRLTSFFYDFMDIVAEHFENEQSILSEKLGTESASEYFFDHLKEHAQLMHDLESLMREASSLNKQGHTAAAIRQLYYRVAERFGDHASAFDAIFLHPGK